MTTSEAPVPRTANLLACKQWWKVCFLYGDQEKYYRQIYGKAASQRIALSGTTPPNDTNDTLHNSNKSPKKFDKNELSMSPDIIFPTGRKSKIPFTQSRDGDNITMGYGMTDELKLNSRVTVLDDPFLFGLSDESISKDSGIIPDTKVNQSSVDIIDCHNSSNDSVNNSMPFNDINDLQLSQDEIKMLHLNNYTRRGNCISLPTTSGILNGSLSSSPNSCVVSKKLPMTDSISNSESPLPPPLPLRGMNNGIVGGVSNNTGSGNDGQRCGNISVNKSPKTSPTFGLNQNGLCADDQNILFDG